MLLYSLLGSFIPFFGTCLGSFIVFFSKRKFTKTFHCIMIGFAIGVMLAASIWSLIIPSIEMSTNFGLFSWFPSVVGLILGVLFLIVVNSYSNKFKFVKNSKSVNMLLFSVILHNIPEGMAVGVCFAGVLSGNSDVSMLSAIVLALGIAIQNIPEGLIVSLPIYSGNNRNKAFFVGVLSGIVEPIAAFVTILLTNFIVPILPYLLSFAAGAMLYVIFEELVLEIMTEEKSKIGIVSIIFGFLIMMVLDVMLG